MATKKKAGATIEQEQPKTNLPVALMERLKKESAALATKIGRPGGDMIRLTKDKRFVLPDGTKGDPGASLSVVILEFVSGSFFYDKVYSDGDPTPPACFALGESPELLVPSARSPDKQADSCAECPMNVFGSKGKGKACGNFRLLAVTQPTDDADAPIWLIKVSSTGIRPFDGYVDTVKSQFSTPPVGVITEIYMDPSSEFQSLRFGNPQANPFIVTHDGRRAAALTRLLTEPDVSSYEAPKKSVARKK